MRWRVTVTAVLGSALCSLALVACGSSGQSTSGTTDVSSTPAAAPASSSPDAGSGTLRPRGETDQHVPVVWVVDGDTIKVDLNGRRTTVRMIGMNTPETVKENTPIECYGPEASDYTKHTLAKQKVTLEYDDSQGRTDQYGRTLAYVWLERPGDQVSLVNLDLVARGLARERQYGPTPYAWKPAFRSAEKQARAAGIGLWGACPT